MLLIATTITATLAAVFVAVPADARFVRPPSVAGAKIIRGACPSASASAAGCFTPDGTIYIGPDEDSNGRVREHELGHLYDARYLDDRERAVFQRLVNRPGPWYPEGDPESDEFHARAPVEVFADRYAHCRLDARGNLYWSTPGLRWFEGRHRRLVCAMIARARFSHR